MSEQKKDEKEPQQLQYPNYSLYYPSPTYYPNQQYFPPYPYPYNLPPNPPNNINPNNGNNKKKVMRISWALLMAFLFAGVFAMAFAVAGYYAGLAYQNMIGVGASNMYLSAEVMNHTGYPTVGYALQSLGSQQMNVAMSIPNQFMYDGSLIGALLGFLLGLYYESKQLNKATHME